MNGLEIYEDLDWFDEVYGDLDLTMLRSGEKHRVFVYGTLMSGMRNHHRLLRDGVRPISTDARTAIQDDWHMFSRTCGCGYTAPIVVEGGRLHRPRGVVLGEVYEIDNSILLDLDLFEGHPEVYRRRKVGIAYRSTKSGEKVAQMWMYEFTGEAKDVTLGIDVARHGAVHTFKWSGE